MKNSDVLQVAKLPDVDGQEAPLDSDWDCIL